MFNFVFSILEPNGYYKVKPMKEVDNLGLKNQSEVGEVNPELLEVLSNYIDRLLAGGRLALLSISAAEGDLRLFSEWLTMKGVDSFEKVDHILIRSWLLDRSKAGDKSSSIRRRLSTLRTFYKYMIKWDQFKHDPTYKVSSPKLGKHLPESIPMSQQLELCRIPEGESSYEEWRDEAIVSLLYASGMRVSELTGLRLGDFDSVRGQIKVLGKRSKERLIPLPEQAVSFLLLYIGEYKRHYEGLTFESPLFASRGGKNVNRSLVYRIANAYLSCMTTVVQRSPHLFRHTYATHLLENGAELLSVKELLGHESLAATQVYTHTSIKRLQEIYNKAHPRAKKEKENRL